LYCLAQENLLYVFDLSFKEIGKHRLEKGLKTVSFWLDGLAISATQTN
jgi:hypothetical protein